MIAGILHCTSFTVIFVLALGWVFARKSADPYPDPVMYPHSQIEFRHSSDPTTEPMHRIDDFPPPQEGLGGETIRDPQENER
jgi:hypothetical protein